MKNELLGKIKSIIEKTVFEECHVVYLMAEIRKMMERVRDSRGQYDLIWFYCNWALHAEINKTSSANRILQKIEDNYKKSGDQSVELDFMNLEYLRKSMKKLMNDLGLPTELFDRKERWQSFKSNLVQVLVDCPLRPRNGNIKEIIYKKRTVIKEGAMITESVSWEIEIITRIETQRFHGSFSNLGK